MSLFCDRQGGALAARTKLRSTIGAGHHDLQTTPSDEVS
jgi:hypothetical protein